MIQGVLARPWAPKDIDVGERHCGRRHGRPDATRRDDEIRHRAIVEVGCRACESRQGSSSRCHPKGSAVARGI